MIVNYLIINTFCYLLHVALLHSSIMPEHNARHALIFKFDVLGMV